MREKLLESTYRHPSHRTQKIVIKGLNFWQFSYYNVPPRTGSIVFSPLPWDRPKSRGRGLVDYIQPEGHSDSSL